MQRACALRNLRNRVVTHVCGVLYIYYSNKMASISRLARCGSRIFSAGSRSTATGRGNTSSFCCCEIFSLPASSPGRGYSTAGSTTLRRAGVSVGAILAGSAVAYGGSLLFRREGSPSIVPAIQAGTHGHQPSVSGACTPCFPLRLRIPCSLPPLVLFPFSRTHKRGSLLFDIAIERW